MTMIREVDEVRDAYVIFGQITNADSSYRFYYDESFNHRKIHIREDGSLNVSIDNNFALGGIVFENKVSTKFDFEDFKRRIKPEKDQTEYKFNHLGKKSNGDFLELLKNDKISKFIDWSLEQDFYIHFTNLNPLYWAIVDIIDSSPLWLIEECGPEYLSKAKNDLYYAIEENLETFLCIAREYSFGDIDVSKQSEFLDKIIDLIKISETAMNEVWKTMLISFMGKLKQAGKLDFIQDFEPYQIVESFDIYYMNRVETYPYSLHCFDKENTVEQKLNASPMSYKGKKINDYCFIDSKLCPQIQISDIMIGYIGRYFSFLKEHKIDQLVKIKSSLDKNQIKQLNSFKEIVSKSNKASTGFLHWIVPELERIKHEFFLNDMDISNMIFE